MVGKIDERKRRFSFDVHYSDLLRNSHGKVLAIMVIEADTNAAYFESMTVEVFKPRIETFRLIEKDFNSAEHDPSRLRVFN